IWKFGSGSDRFPPFITSFPAGSLGDRAARDSGKQGILPQGASCNRSQNPTPIPRVLGLLEAVAAGFKAESAASPTGPWVGVIMAPQSASHTGQLFERAPAPPVCCGGCGGCGCQRGFATD